MGQVMPHTATTFHQLYLFLVHFHDTTIRVGAGIITDNKTIGQRRNLEIVTDTGHRASLRNDIFEMLEQRINQFLAHRIGIFFLDTGKLAGHTVMHLIRITFHQLTFIVFQRILVNPYACCQFVTIEIFHHFLENILFFIRFHRLLLYPLCCFYLFMHTSHDQFFQVIELHLFQTALTTLNQSLLTVFFLILHLL